MHSPCPPSHRFPEGDKTQPEGSSFRYSPLHQHRRLSTLRGRCHWISPESDMRQQSRRVGILGAWPGWQPSKGALKTVDFSLSTTWRDIIHQCHSLSGLLYPGPRGEALETKEWHGQSCGLIVRNDQPSWQGLLTLQYSSLSNQHQYLHIRERLGKELRLATST